MTSTPPPGTAESPASEAWPFLVTQGFRLGVHVVVAPEFLYAAGDTDAVFASAQTGPGIAIGGPTSRVVEAASGEPLTLLYRHVPATAEEVGITVTGALGDEPGPTLLRDVDGRPISLIEGFAMRGRYGHVPVTDDEWQHVHRIVLAAYQRFLYNEGRGPTLIPSGRMSLATPGTPTGSPPTSAAKPEPTYWSVRRSAVIVVVSLIILAAVIAVVTAS
jgi:hypothetical protein